MLTGMETASGDYIAVIDEIENTQCWYRAKLESDLNTACTNYLLDNIVGESVFDAACGRGALLKRKNKIS